MEEELSKEKVNLHAVEEESQTDSASSSEERDDDSEPTFDEAQVSLAQNILGDRFEVLSLLGQGGMGSVYKVKDTNTGRIVALKLMKPELCKDKSARKRFMQEAEFSFAAR